MKSCFFSYTPSLSLSLFLLSHLFSTSLLPSTLPTSLPPSLHTSFVSLPHSLSQLIEKACSEGQVQVLKLLVSSLPELNPVVWLAHTMVSLERLESNNVAKRTALTAVAQFVFNLDPTMTMSTIVRFAEKYSKASLYLINEFCNQSKHERHFVMCGVALMVVPVRWVANSMYTHINLTNNLLTSLPKEIFQLSSLRTLNVSHNCLESIPSILSWNSPKLKELNVSYNRLVDEKYFILEGRKSRENRINRNPPSNEVQRERINEAQRVLRLTGYNLYPCICSLSKVNISHNISLSQVRQLSCLVWCARLLVVQPLGIT